MAAALCLMACSGVGSETPAEVTFQDYWFAGKAELTRYELQQARYGEIREGDAVLIFVTEPFLKDRQVKYEFGDQQAATSVLKLNFTRKFYTGIYPYSMMTSVFTPLQFRDLATLKVTTSVQEWCGHTFMQLNHKENTYQVALRSYFQAEGDRDFEIADALLEDEIWTRIRLDPAALPTGAIKIIPGGQFVRLKHVALGVAEATANLAETADAALSSDALYRYVVDYADLDRELAIVFEKSFPHRILAWEESCRDGFGVDARVLTTRAVRSNSMLLDYWSKNRVSDSHLRDELGIVY
jgi:hypothetical protein